MNTLIGLALIMPTLIALGFMFQVIFSSESQYRFGPLRNARTGRFTGNLGAIKCK